MIRWMLLVVLAVAGCEGKPAVPSASAGGLTAEVLAERAKLSVEDRAMVEAQEWCVVSDDEHLGSMGPPVRISIQGQPVFLCCEGCRKKAESDPAKTLAKLEELKAKAKAAKDTRK